MIRHTAFSIALIFAPAAFAQAYIVPDGDCGAITLHVANTIDPDRVTNATVFLPKKKLAVGSGSLTFAASIPEEGVVMAAVDLEPVVHGNETRTEHAKGDLPMDLYRAGGGRIAEGVHAQNGGVTFPYQEPGSYMVVTTYRRPDPQQPEHILVDTSTLTFEIK